MSSRVSRNVVDNEVVMGGRNAEKRKVGKWTLTVFRHAEQRHYK